MDERSRKLLSPEVVPKADRPAPVPHAKREFKLPAGVSTAPPDLAELRAKALGMVAGARKAAGSVPPPIAVMTINPAPPVIPVAAPKAPAAKSAKPAKAAKGSKKTPAPEPVKATGKPTVSKPLGSPKWPAIGTPPPPPAGLVAKAAPQVLGTPVAPPKPSAVPAVEKTPAPLPPPPHDVVPARPAVVPPPLPVEVAAAGSAPIVVASERERAPMFREATSMWFKRGDEEAEAAEWEAARDAAEAQATLARTPGVLLGRWNRTHALIAAAGGAFALIVIIAIL